MIAADLFAQEDVNLQAQPMWFQPKGDQGWQRFSGYTYGYNHSLFVKRVHDVLTMIAFADANTDAPIQLVGLGAVAGPLALAARSQAGDRVGKAVIDLQGFRFQQLRRHDDPMFVPGAVKYLDVDGLLAICAPAEIEVLGNEAFPIADKVYAASDTPAAFHRAAQSADVLELLD